MNNKFNKFKQFIKKEGFYVVLFVCLCAVATVAAITAGGNKDTASKPSVTQGDKGTTVTEPKNPQDALQVKEDIKPVPNVQVQNSSKAVSNPNDKPPQPQNKSITLNFFIYSYLFYIIIGFFEL